MTIDWKAEYLKSVESGCITLDELREARAELDATNRQVEILSDALAESRREVAAMKQALASPVQDCFWKREGYKECPAAQRQWVGLTDEVKRELIKNSALWDMHIHIGWYSAPAKSFAEKTIQLIADIEAKLKEKNT
jgi:hypothetical protein